MISQQVTLLDFFVRVYSVRRPLAANTEYQYQRSICAFSEWLGHDALVMDLTDDLVSRWIADSSGHLAPRTIAGRRGDILCVWRMAASVGLCGAPSDVRRVKVQRPIPRSWSQEDLRLLLEAADRVSGYFGNGIPRSLYLRTLIEVGYYTGLRRDDLWKLRLVDVDANGQLSVVVRKTGRGHVSGIPPETLKRLQAISRRLRQDGQRWPDQPLRWPHAPRGIYYWLERVCRAAGVEYGAMQQLRRTGATACESVQPGSATRYLGHRSPGMAERHYLDRRRLGQAVAPPRL